MSQPILSLQSSDSADNKAVANLLPCRIHHSGQVDPVQPYWKPVDGEGDKKIAYFRGRKLYGKTTKLPATHRGVVVERLPLTKDADAAEGQEETEQPESNSGTMKVTATFDEMIIWGHESVSDVSTDPYLRSMEEWLQVADQINSYQKRST